MKDIIIIGSGGHAAEIDEYILYNKKHSCCEEMKIIGFLDDNPDNYARYKFSAPLIDSVIKHKVLKDCFYIIGIAGTQYRRLLVQRYIGEGARFASLVHCTAYISSSATIGEGTIIGPNSNIGPNVCIGKYTLINSRCSLGHDTIVGDYNILSPNTCLSGFTKVGDENLIGINCATIPGIIIGDRNKIAAGMIVDNNVGDDSVVFYRYKERIIAVPKRNND